VTSPPYDVVVRPEGLRHLETADPHNIVRLILPQTPDAPAARHQQAAETLRRWMAEEILEPDPEPALYVYEQHHGDILQRGIIGALRLSEPAEGVVLPHEDVMPDIVEDRTGLMRATHANFEPLLLSYRGGGNAVGATAVIERVVHRAPLLSTITEDGFGHLLWAVTDPADLAEIQTDLSRHQALIADGHHRWATYLRLRTEHATPGPWDFGLVLLVDTARHPLQVRAIHRVLPGLPVAEAINSAEAIFRVRPVDGPLPRALDALAATAEVSAGETSSVEAPAANSFLLAGDGRFHLLDDPDPEFLARAVPQDRPEAWRTLDATVLHSALLEQMWGIPDGPEHIAYIHGAEAAVSHAELHGGTAILMRPVREDVVRDLARQGVTMPRKSTSFGPKPATGLVLRSLALD
jgi:uncharacterized protein (DUF1015 family)